MCSYYSRTLTFNIVSDLERERERDRETERQRHTDRQTDRQTDRDRERQKQTETERDRDEKQRERGENITLSLPLSPWYNRNGWLGAKQQITLSLSLTIRCLHTPKFLSLSDDQMSSYTQVTLSLSLWRSDVFIHPSYSLSLTIRCLHTPKLLFLSLWRSDVFIHPSYSLSDDQMSSYTQAKFICHVELSRRHFQIVFMSHSIRLFTHSKWHANPHTPPSGHHRMRTHTHAHAHFRKGDNARWSEIKETLPKTIWGKESSPSRCLIRFSFSSITVNNPSSVITIFFRSRLVSFKIHTIYGAPAGNLFKAYLITKAESGNEICWGF